MEPHLTQLSSTQPRVIIPMNALRCLWAENRSDTLKIPYVLLLIIRHPQLVPLVDYTPSPKRTSPLTLLRPGPSEVHLYNVRQHRLETYPTLAMGNPEQEHYLVSPIRPWTFVTTSLAFMFKHSVIPGNTWRPSRLLLVP